MNIKWTHSIYIEIYNRNDHIYEISAHQPQSRNYRWDISFSSQSVLSIKDWQKQIEAMIIQFTVNCYNLSGNWLKPTQIWIETAKASCLHPHSSQWHWSPVWLGSGRPPMCVYVRTSRLLLMFKEKEWTKERKRLNKMQREWYVLLPLIGERPTNISSRWFGKLFQKQLKVFGQITVVLPNLKGTEGAGRSAIG